MKTPIFTGSGLAMITPMNPDGSVNYTEIDRILEDQIAAHTDAIIACGTTGEGSTLSDEEHVEVIRYTVERAAGRVPVIAGTGSNCTDYAIWLTQQACQAGADAVLVVTPYYNKATQRGLYESFTAIADKSTKPLILYNVPSRTGCSIAPETYARLAEHENIVAIKEACGDISKIAQTAALVDGKLDIYSGNDDQIVPILALGAFFNCLCSYQGGIYVAYKKTASVGMTTIAAAAINLAVDVALVRQIGIYAGSVSTLISFLALFLFRMHDMKKFQRIDYDYMTMLGGILLLAVMCVLAYRRNAILNVLNMALAAAGCVAFSGKLLKRMAMKILSKGKKKA